MKQILINFFLYQGRASRSEWWKSIIVYYIFLIFLVVLLGYIFPVLKTGIYQYVLLQVVLFFTVINGVSFRRFHDLDKSGLFMFLMFFGYLLASLFPVLFTAFMFMGLKNGVLITLFLCGGGGFLGTGLFFMVSFLKGTTGPNLYGPDPLDQNSASPTLAQPLPLVSNAVIGGQPVITTQPIGSEVPPVSHP